jgi:hypothetical protein
MVRTRRSNFDPAKSAGCFRSKPDDGEVRSADHFGVNPGKISAFGAFRGGGSGSGGCDGGGKLPSAAAGWAAPTPPNSIGRLGDRRD